jgi:membrane-associated phospholipid phosphatase
VNPLDEPRRTEYIGERDLTDWPTRVGRRVAGSVVDARSWTAARLAVVLTVVIGVTVVGLLSAASAEVYESVTENGTLAALDQPALDLAVSWRTPAAGQVVTWFTDIGGKVGMPVLALVLTAVLVWRWRSWTPAVLVVVAAAGSLLMTTAGKDLIGRARPPRSLAVPPYEASASFPSGHTLNATVVIGILGYLALRDVESPRGRAAVVAAGASFVLAMGLSRVFLGHHWLTDVVMGWTLGLAWVGCVITAHRLWLTMRRRHV